jgi:hypothetical protein
MNSLVSTETAEAITARVEQRKRSILDTIESYRRYIATNEERLAEVEAQTVRLFEVKLMLEAAGFTPELDSWCDSLSLTLKDEGELKGLYPLVGRFNGEGRSVDLVNPRKKLIRVTLTSIQHPFLSVRFETRLPAGAACRIERVKTKARVEARLVCTA